MYAPPLPLKMASHVRDELTFTRTAAGWATA